jgi:hypothetical protein
VKVANQSQTPLKGVELAYERGVLPLVEHEDFAGLGVVRVDVNREVEVRFVCRMGEPGDRSFHFLAAVGGLPIAFATATCTVFRTLRIESRIMRHPHETHNELLQCTIRSDVDGVSFAGIIDREGWMLTAVSSPRVPLNRGQSFSVVATTCDMTTKTPETWRLPLMDSARFAILITSDDADLAAQANILVEPESPGMRFRIEMAAQYDRGQSIECRITLVQPVDFAGLLYVRPMQVSSADGVCVLVPWIGTSLKRLSAEDGLSITFMLAPPTAPGFYLIKGFVVADNPGFVGYTEIRLTHMFTVR